MRFNASDFIHDDIADKDVPRTLRFTTTPAKEKEATGLDAVIRIKEIAGKSEFRGRSKHLRAYLRLLGECEATINTKGSSSKFKGDVIVGDMIFH